MKIFIPDEVLSAFKRMDELNQFEKENRSLTDNQVDEIISLQAVINEFYESL